MNTTHVFPWPFGREFKAFKLSTGDAVAVGEEAKISWEMPEGKTHELDPKLAREGEWYINSDKTMALLKKPNRNQYPGDPRYMYSEDGVLVLSLEAAPSLATTLVCEEDDIADRVYYFATDHENQNPLRKPAFILRALGAKGSPLKHNCGFRVLCARK